MPRLTKAQQKRMLKAIIGKAGKLSPITTAGTNALSVKDFIAIQSICQRALNKLKHLPSEAYIDGIYAPKNLEIKCKTFIKGDERIKCISAASIIAKVSRDLFMINLAKNYPGYLWQKNFGYGTKEHIIGLKKYGITKHHRKKFKPIHYMLLNDKRETL